MKPCQPFSHAGKRDGTDDARHIWPHIADAIRVLRPRFVFLENVAGHLSLGFGDVLGDLAEAGYDARWCCVRASDVGAPHRRERVFIVASLRHTGHDAGGSELGQQSEGSTGWTTEPDKDIAPDTASNGRAERWTEPTPRQRGHGATVSGAALSPDTRWGDYAPAVAQWEHVTERTAPDATAPNRDGKPRLSPRFVEWMMGLPAGWVTDVPGISRTGQLHLLGNGVVPQQARAALAVIA